MVSGGVKMGPIKGLELRAYLELHPDRMRIICQTCGRTYGDHRGFECPDGIGRFEPVMEDVDKNNPNLIFRLKNFWKKV